MIEIKKQDTCGGSNYVPGVPPCPNKVCSYATHDDNTGHVAYISPVPGVPPEAATVEIALCHKHFVMWCALQYAGGIEDKIIPASVHATLQIRILAATLGVPQEVVMEMMGFGRPPMQHDADKN